MKRFLIVLIMICFVCGISFAADVVEGFWLSVDEKTGKVTAGWHVYQQNNKLYGIILSSADGTPDELATKVKESYAGFPLPGKVNQMKVNGTPWIFGLSMDKPGEWSGGNIIDPQDGKMYKCKIIFRTADGKKYKTDVLEMRGEIGLGIGRSQFWQRTDESTAGSL